MNDLSRLRDILFVLRCMFSATLAYWLGTRLGLEIPSWAAVSAIVVSQESLVDTKVVALRRLIATMLGVFIALMISIPLGYLDISLVIQMALGVGVASVIARRWPQLRVAMWTVPIIYFSGAEEHAPAIAGMWRSVEVLVGGLSGATIHFLSEKLYSAISRKKTS